MNGLDRPTTETVGAVWDANAAFWDARMGEGNRFHRELVEPAADGLLEPQAGQRILEIACGNGQYARHLAQLGAAVVACDLSSAFIDIARRKSVAAGLDIDYRVMDAGERAQLLALGRRAFDAVVCNMALMDMADIESLFATLPRLLHPRGRFVFTITHPCFNHSGVALVAEEVEEEGALLRRFWLRVSRYLTVGTTLGVGMKGQPKPHYYFHRPLGELLQAGFSAGFVLDGVEERAFAASEDADGPLSWTSFDEIPPVLAARLRLPG